MSKQYLKPRKALNKAFLKIKPNRTQIESFKINLIQVLDSCNEKESEEFHKNLVSDFLKNTYYSPNHFVNTKGRNDLVIHNGKDAKSTVGVIIEAKSPANKSEMISVDNLNGKAFQELVLYFLRERITHKNLEIKHLVVTNIYEWFVFDAQEIDKLFAQNKSFVKQFEEFEGKQLSGIKTDFFYKDIAKPFIENIKDSIEFTYFDFRSYDKQLRNDDKEDDKSLVALFKLLSPEHLLKLSFANDSNSLDKNFYSELLHIIGLTETKEGGKKLIQRHKKEDRNTGSLLENAITQLDSLDKISRLQNPKQYGDTNEERLFNVALELSITWVNRILFLKLLEAQLITYHKGDKSYSFLNNELIHDYDKLNKLFFQVLAKKPNERNESVLKDYAKVPYLNSSLFEPTELEHETLFISMLEDEDTLPLLTSTVIKDKQGKKIKGQKKAIDYFFSFLDAYDFASEGSEDIQEDNKTLINASVLGLIFEKINGYKDGSFFTPGFITMYMCKETIRRAVVQKFNEVKNWNCENFTDLYNKIDDKKEANAIINSLKVCDPAVGSGHFLVSALNELIVIKHDLKILQDQEGKSIRDYNIEIVNDELMITDDDNIPFTYNPSNKESQRIQETLFKEKETLIENCLFGVDINPNSVKICRLRLWIELLKNAFYTTNNELETLPNIDINIKCGNSLISRFDLDTDLKKALKQSKWNISSYKLAVATYRNAENKEQKREMERLIDDIKGNFRSEISSNSKEVKDLIRFKNEYYLKYEKEKLFEINLTKAEQKAKKELTDKISKNETILEEIKSNKIYENAFEWRFEFPEVLDDKGDFVGFDVVIGNPPYFSISAIPELTNIANKYCTYNATGDIYTLFIELSHNILKLNSLSTLIISNKWMRANYGASLRKYLIENTNPIELIDFGQNLIFESAIVHTNIITTQKSKNKNNLEAVRFPDGYFDINTSTFIEFIENNKINNLKVSENIWNVVERSFDDLKIKAEEIGIKLKEWDININFGIKTGFNEAFIIDDNVRNELIIEDENNEEIIKPILRGRDTRSYYANFANLFIINSHNGYLDIPRIDIVNNYPSIYKHLMKYELKASQRSDKGKHWTNLRNCAYLDKFELPKIIFSEIVSEPQFFYDEQGYFPEATVFFISGKHLKYLTALLNSKTVTFLFKSFYMGGELVGKIRYKKAFLENVPIPIPSQEIENIIDFKVDQILALKKEDAAADTSVLEREIDVMVYELYGLSEEEIKIVEES
jgi:adenine-specific DNA-methyltransferase